MSWKTKFEEITKLVHSEQAKFWLNGFWEEGGKEEADKVWDICHTFIELDVGFPILYGGRMREYKESADLDEMKSHVILEKLGETMTVLALRKRLEKLDLDSNKRMALSEYLLDKYGKTPEALCKSPQGTLDPAELKKAEDQLAAAGAALDEAAEALAASEKADAELADALTELKRIEDEYNGKIAKFEAKIANPDTSSMKRSMAKNELAQLQAEDPLPLRKAKLTTKAAKKRAEKQVKRAAASKAAAEKAVAEAEEALQTLKSSGGTGTPQGVLYWMEKTLAEKKKFMR